MTSVTVQRDVVLLPLQAVSGVVERRHTLPILSNVLIELESDQLSVTATDLELQVSSRSQTPTEGGTQSTTVSARKLQDILRALPEDSKVSLDMQDKRLQLMHAQFDDLYILYQMNDPMYFFNMEDMWDDGDEVLGPILDEGTAIRFSIEPYYMMVDTADPLIPDAKQTTQFSLVMLFTPEKALNLRAIPMIYQDGEDYGRMICFQMPKGRYFLGPLG